jgi:hypothetical protein
VGGIPAKGVGASGPGTGSVWTSDNVFLTSLRYYPF